MKPKVMIITGGANGIGKAMVETFARDHHHVYFMDVDLLAGKKLEQELNGYDCTFLHCDIANQHQLESCVALLIKKTPKIDVIVNNACMSHGGIDRCGYDDFVSVLKVGLVAPYYLSQLLLPYMNEKASIIHIASTRAFQSQPNTESYSATKGGIIALTHAMSVSLAGRVRVNSISPGWIDTTQTSHFSDADRTQHPSQRIGTPMDIVRAVYFLADEANDFINGENIVIDGGMSKQMIYHQDHGWIFNPSKGQ